MTEGDNDLYYDWNIHFRFWEKVDITGLGDDDCWEWTGATRMGYGALRVGDRVESTHRMSIQMRFGEIEDDDLYVLHRCNNKPCVRLGHLYLGTHSQNMKDAHADGLLEPPEAFKRQRFDREGDRTVGNTRKLSETVAKSLCRLIKAHKKGVGKFSSLKEISEFFADEDVTYYRVKDISCGRAYQDIYEDVEIPERLIQS